MSLCIAIFLTECRVQLSRTAIIIICNNNNLKQFC